MGISRYLADLKTFRDYLWQVYYWYDRFEFSRDVDHLDNAERNAEVVRGYLPKGLQRLSVIGIYNLYLYSPSLQKGGSK